MKVSMEFAVVEFDSHSMMRILVYCPDKTRQIKACSRQRIDGNLQVEACPHKYRLLPRHGVLPG